MQASDAAYTPQRNPIRLGDAWRALRKLIANPDGTDQVFVIIDALSGNSGERQFRRFAASPVGQRVLDEKHEILDVLSDRDSLHSLPPGTLGKTYANFMSNEQISADGLVEASEEVGPAMRINEDRSRFGERMRDSHDLWHCVTGYSRDLVGEASLLAFTFAQTRNPGIGAIVAMAFIKAGALSGARKSIIRGYRRGRRAGWLPAADWETLLARPLEEVRTELAVGPLPEYTEQRSEAGEAALKSQ